ncbi:YdcF family protein [Wenzhouxiangella sp. EGI_FJ10305]|uniref:YdcF family protein n=1 Tax=Wenzhouxiangella sp. EGI_FJ10305 TaxID=3243768 RepID=UPI0035D6ACB2
MTWYSPLVPLLVGMLLLAVSAFGSRRRLALFGLLLILPAFALMTPLGANLLVLVIEHRTKAAETAPVCDRVQATVLMSGGLRRPAETARDFGALTEESLARIFAWQELDSIDKAPNLPLIISGGGPFRIPEAEVVGTFLNLLVPEHPPLQLETVSTNTWDSARAVRKLLPGSINRIMLASSALHLPRVMLAFEKAGFEVCPLALNRHYLAVTGWTTLLPQSSSLAKSESALHEIIGEVSYRLRDER